MYSWICEWSQTDPSSLLACKRGTRGKSEEFCWGKNKLHTCAHVSWKIASCHTTARVMASTMLPLIVHMTGPLGSPFKWQNIKKGFVSFLQAHGLLTWRIVANKRDVVVVECPASAHTCPSGKPTRQRRVLLRTDVAGPWTRVIDSACRLTISPSTRETSSAPGYVTGAKNCLRHRYSDAYRRNIYYILYSMGISQLLTPTEHEKIEHVILIPPH